MSFCRIQRPQHLIPLLIVLAMLLAFVHPEWLLLAQDESWFHRFM
jgi:hypothetical protein